MPRTAAICYRPSDDAQRAIKHYAATHGVAMSAVINALIARLPGTPPAANTTPAPPPPKKTGTINASYEIKSRRNAYRLSPSEDRQLAAAALSVGQAKGAFVVSCVRAALLKQPELLDAEIAAVNESSRQLVRIGNNLNQITRRLNEQPGPPDGLLAALKAVQLAVSAHEARTADLVRAAEERWA